MAVSDEDVRHIAALARLGIDPSRIPIIARELSGILAHMEALSRVDTAGARAPASGEGGSLPLRADGGAPIPLHRAREAFAPEMRDGFFLVPRLATHEDALDEDLEA